MRIDAHTHVGSALKDDMKGNAGRFIEMLDANDIDAAVVLPLDGLLSNCVDHKTDNDFIFEFCNMFPDRLFPGFCVNPLNGDAALDEIKRCKNELGLNLLKLHPWLQGFSISSEEMDAVAELCQKLEINIVFHDGTPPYCTPLQMARLCRDYPLLKVVSGHSGLNDLWSDAIAAAKRFSNYYLCLCGLPLGPMQRVINEVRPEQICVGSDFINLAEDVLWYRWSVWRKTTISDETRQIIESTVPMNLLGIKE